MATKCYHWTETEKIILSKYCLDGIDTLKSKLPERSEGAIRCKMSTMGLQTQPENKCKVERLFRVRLDG
jgi:hypothetical protein